MARKKSKPEKKPPSLPIRLLRGLEEADVLIEQERWAEAQELLLDLDLRFPDQPEVLAPLAHVCIEQQKWAEFLYASERLALHDPDDPELQLALAGAYLSSNFPASALITMRAFQQRWPLHEEAEEAQHMLAELEGELDKLFAQERCLFPEGVHSKQSFSDWLKLLREMESVENLAIQGRFRQAIARGEAALRQSPDFVPLLNKLTMAYWLNGQMEKAIDCVQRAVASQPQDATALGNLAKFSFLSGRIDDALVSAQRLKALYTTSYTHAAKTIEVLAFLGEPTELIRAFEWLEQRNALDPLGSEAGYLLHLAAAAQANQGEYKKAIKLWKKALEVNPQIKEAQENLDDLEKPVGERNGPFTYVMQEWLSPKASENLEREMQTISKDHENGIVIERALRRWAARHPEVNKISPYMLSLANENGREFLLSLAEITRSSELLVAIKDFSLGQSGRDELRLAAANQAVSAGLLPAGMHKLWLDGQWTETLLIGINLVPSVERRHPPKVEKWLRAALSSARDGQYKQAESLLRDALEVEPDAPDLLYNLAAACQNQRRFAESEELLERVVTHSSDYVLAASSLAQLCISRNQLQRAHQLLESLRQIKQMSHSEFDAFCAAHVDLYLAEKDKKTAQAWFGVWESADPNNSRLARYKSLW